MEAACLRASAGPGETRTKPVVSRAGLSAPADASALTLACLAEERRVGLLICLARESGALRSFGYSLCSHSTQPVLQQSPDTFSVAC